MAEKFPIMGDKQISSIPWALIAPHEKRAMDNHGQQTLKRLAERGGLSTCEACAVLENRPWHKMPNDGARHDLLEAVARFETNTQ